MPFSPDYRSRNDDEPADFDLLPEDERWRISAERSRLLHIHGPATWHDSVCIFGNRNALTVLRDALTAALADGKAETYAMTMDGEGFAVEITLNNAAWEHPSWETAPLPYSDPIARGQPDPWSDVAVIRHALRMANAALVKRGVKPIADPTAWRATPAKPEGGRDAG